MRIEYVKSNSRRFRIRNFWWIVWRFSICVRINRRNSLVFFEQFSSIHLSTWELEIAMINPMCRIGTCDEFFRISDTNC